MKLDLNRHLPHRLCDMHMAPQHPKNDNLGESETTEAMGLEKNTFTNGRP